MLMLPEIIVVLTAGVVLCLDLFLTERSRVILAPVTLLGLALGFAALLVTPQTGDLLGGRFGMDPIAWWFKVIFLIAGFVTVILSMDLLDGRAAHRMRGIGFRGEYYTILLSTIVGMMFLISARETITLYVSLETATIPLFVLTAWRRDHVQSGEAGLKYVIIGALASAFILYGLSILYGLTGQTSIVGMSAKLADVPRPAFWLAAAMLMTGVGFKLTIVPFHMWAADVYEGAPAPVTAYLSVASKAAGLAFMFQVFYRIFGSELAGWTPLIAAFAAVTMSLGNLVAIVQDNIKRFMAFSAISQAGYLILGFLGPADNGVPAMLFYMLVYILSNLAVFACIVWYSNETGRERIEEYRGLSLTNPIMALGMMIALFSLAGIPPLSGFVGKFFLFSIAAKAGYNWLVAVAAVNSTISLFYYLRIVRQMYIEPIYEGAGTLPVRYTVAATVGLLSLAVALMGVIPYFYETIHAQTITWLASLIG
ncbi:MAG: NADH-quinone oxidoreductase subunit N [Candidatus Hydrogenedentes bacterium]|nr:NADH-quinone oxidoreductase subunit N [Candidatus Hydrogenedentota bacterium]